MTSRSRVLGSQHCRCPQRSFAIFKNPRGIAAANSFQKPPKNKGPPRDEEIRAKYVQLVDEDQSLKPPELLARVLQSFDRQEHYLIQVTQPEPGRIPVCKLVQKEKLREKLIMKETASRNNKGVSTKQLELNWAIGPNDLDHRMSKAHEFLEKGKRVEIILAPKRKGKKATEEEAKNVLSYIRERVAKVEGAREWKDMEGVPGGQVTLHLQGKQKSVPESPGDGTDKVK